MKSILLASNFLITLIKSEKQEDLHNTLIVPCSQLRSLHDGGATVQVHPAPGFCALATDPILLSHGITLEIGRVKNPNKNSVAERAIEELSLELLNLSPEGGPVSDVTLALATANTNSRIRRDGLSAREVWTRGDQLTGEQLPIVDRQLILSQNYSRQQNHTPSAKSKARGRTNLPSAVVSVGDLVFLKGDRDKLKAREKYLVVSIREDLSCELRKFTTSQFRSKVYSVPMSACYPVALTVLAQSLQGSIRGLHKPSLFDSDDDADPVTLPPRHGSATCARRSPCSGTSFTTSSHCPITLHSSIFSRLLGSLGCSTLVCCCRSSQEVRPSTKRPILAKSGL